MMILLQVGCVGPSQQRSFGLLRFTGCGVYFVFGNKCGYKWPQPDDPVWTDVLAVCPGHGLLKSMYGLTCMFENNICMVGTRILSGPSSLHIPGWQLPPIKGYTSMHPEHMPGCNMARGAASQQPISVVSQVGTLFGKCLDESFPSWMVEQALWSPFTDT